MKTFVSLSALVGGVACAATTLTTTTSSAPQHSSSTQAICPIEEALLLCAERDGLCFSDDPFTKRIALERKTCKENHPYEAFCNDGQAVQRCCSIYYQDEDNIFPMVCTRTDCIVDGNARMKIDDRAKYMGFKGDMRRCGECCEDYKHAND